MSQQSRSSSSLLEVIVRRRRSPFAVRRSLFAVRCSPFAVRRSLFAVRCSLVRRSPFAVRRSLFAVRRSLFAVRCRRLWVLCLTQISSLKFRPRARRRARPRGTTMRRTIPELNFGFRRLRLTDIQLRLTKDCHSRFSWPKNLAT
jgi:hypothetical protein